MRDIRITVGSGVEGPHVSIDAINIKGESTVGTRVGGPKPWGGSRTINSWLVNPEELKKAIDEAVHDSD